MIIILNYNKIHHNILHTQGIFKSNRISQTILWQVSNFIKQTLIKKTLIGKKSLPLIANNNIHY